MQAPLSDRRSKTPATPRRGRPRDPSIELAIAEAAWGVLSDRGYVAFSFEEVASRAGCSRPALYRRFSTKRDLLLWMIDKAARETEPHLGASRDPRIALVEMLSGFVTFLQSAAGISIATLAHARVADAALSTALDDLYLRERAHYLPALKQAIGKPLGRSRLHVLTDNMIGAVAFRVGLQRHRIAQRDIADIVDQTIAWGKAKAGAVGDA